MNYTRTKYACFLTSFSTAITCNLSPLLFLIFREIFGFSYTLLGLLVLINFGTQLIFDLLFSFYSHKFNLPLCVKLTPAFIVLGLIIYSVLPALLPGAAYAGLVIGTVIFSMGSGLSEVLTSPTVAAIPDKNADRLMSRLHSCYAWGVVFTVAVCTVFLSLAGTEAWYWLALLLSLLPLAASLLFIGAPIPTLETQEKTSAAVGLFKNKVILLGVLAIFLGGATECTMSQWCSSYLEKAFGLDKTIGDLCGVALFGVMLGLGRSLYGKYGKKVIRFLLAGSAGAIVCYAVAAFSPWPLAGVIACAMTGLCASLLWPGTLTEISDRVPDGGVTMYALLAAGGDMGASLVPQAVGVITDIVIATRALDSLGLSPEQLGMKAGMAFGLLCPICAFFVFLKLYRMKK